MAIDLESQITPLTVDEIRTSIYQTIAATGTDHTTWIPGAVMRTFITGVAIVLAAFSRLQARIAAGGYLEYSTGNWLTLLAYFVFGVQRIEATFATGEITLDNAGGGLFSIDAFEATFTDPSTGRQFQNTAAFTLNPLETDLVVPIQAVEAGASSSALAGSITEITSPAMADVACVNVSPLVASDQESDSQLRVRCLERLGALSPLGPWDAYSFAAKGAGLSTGGAAGITRVHTTKDGFGNVFAYLATDSGPAVGTLGDTATPLGAADEAMQRLAVPQAVTLVTSAATQLNVDLTYSVWVYSTSSLTNNELTVLINQAINDYFKTVPIGGHAKPGEGGRIRAGAIERLIRNLRSEIFAVTLSGTGFVSGEKPVAANEVPVLVSLVASEIIRVDPEGLG